MHSALESSHIVGIPGSQAVNPAANAPACETPGFTTAAAANSASTAAPAA
jgi:hypothetical protein